MLNKETITTRELISLTSFSNAYLGKLESEGIIRRDAKDTWLLVSTINSIVTHLRRPRHSEAADRLATVKANALEQKIAREASELIPAEEVAEYSKFITGSIISRLAALPPRFTRDLVERSRLETMINNIRSEVADLVEREAARLGGDHNGFNHHANGR